VFYFPPNVCLFSFLLVLQGTQRRLNALSEKILGAAFEVSNVLGAGFLEKVYENALSFELNLSGSKTIQQAPLKVFYKRIRYCSFCPVFELS
jgi:hypothetical protein